MKHCNFDSISSALQVQMKKQNTITEKWPNQMKLEIGQEGAEEEFRTILGSNCTSVERYVEWKRDD
jgi:hypothetical protein